MKAVFGVVSLLVVLAVVGVLATRPTKTALAVSPAASAAPDASVRQQSQQIQDQVRQDVNKALDEAARRTEAADK